MSSDFSLHDKWLKKLDREIQDLSCRIGFDKKTLDEVFDKTTLLRIGKLISNKVIDHFDFPISTGKEAIVFRAVTSNDEFVAIKIYRTSNLAFKHIAKYIDGDPRFNLINKTRRGVIDEWAKKEYKNLEKLKDVNVRAPIPIKKMNNILIMEYIGDFEKPAPLLKDSKLDNPKKIFDTILNYISLMYSKAGFVHADLSAYNILIFQGKPYVIDVGQGVILDHPESIEFLKRDIYNILKYFKKFDITADEKEIFERITKNSDV
jgi:RIO kinase 1